MFLGDRARLSCKKEVMDCHSTICTGPLSKAVTIWVIYTEPKKKHFILLLYHIPAKSLQMLPWPFCESPSFCPSSEIIISVHKPYMYPIVIWFGEQKWQISLKSAQVDYPLISKAHALRVPHNWRMWLRGKECPAYPASAEHDPSASTMPCVSY